MKNELKEMIINFIIPFYNEPHRHYHDLNHIFYMLEMAKVYCIKLTDEQFIAINFHDIVYDPTQTGGQNEIESAKMVGHFNKINGYVLSDESVKIIQSIIIDTIQHRATTSESEVVLDLDLIALAADWGAFRKAGANIRFEYSHLDDCEFDNGRIVFLESMLARDTIFSTKHFRSVAEKQAKDNLYRELNNLKKAVDKLKKV